MSPNVNDHLEHNNDGAAEADRMSHGGEFEITLAYVEQQWKAIGAAAILFGPHCDLTHAPIRALILHEHKQTEKVQKHVSIIHVLQGKYCHLRIYVMFACEIFLCPIDFV